MLRQLFSARRPAIAKIAPRVFISSSLHFATNNRAINGSPKLPNTQLIFRSTMYKYTTDSQNDYNYMEVVENTLETLSENFLEIEDHVAIPGFDCSCSDGVLKLDLGPHGQYVINKQPPNKQLWISSPVCGPKRYAWDTTLNKWVNTRDNHCLISLLNNEIKQLLSIDLGMTPEKFYKNI